MTSCNSSSLEEVVNLVRSMASVQQEMKEKIDGIELQCDSEMEPSKQALVSALVGKFVVSMYFDQCPTLMQFLQQGFLSHVRFHS